LTILKFCFLKVWSKLFLPYFCTPLKKERLHILVCCSLEEEELVAQLVEHITFNDGVLGSSPSQFTKPLLK
jgi:hypothetical protein